MTAEVGVMNRIGVALAADSAVTVGRAPRKIYSSADKLFQLAENAPVAIMFYGNSNLLGVPWETIIKAYRSRLGSRTFPGLRDYLRHFLRFLRTEKRMFPAAQQKAFVDLIASDFFSYLRKKLNDLLQNELNRKASLTEQEVKRILTDLVRDELHDTMGFPEFDGVTANTVQNIQKRYRNLIAAARRRTFEKLPISQVTQRRLSHLVSHLLTRSRLEHSNLHSGVVIAGFGEREHFPVLLETAVAGIVAGHLLHRQRAQLEVGKDANGWVVPFAQREMVATFMDGIDPNHRLLVERLTAMLFQKVAGTILGDVSSKHPRYGKTLQKKVEASLRKLLDDFRKDWNDTCSRHFSGPVMEMVASLPKDELGAMAESLVNLTKFKRRVSKEQETVGGPIDVAVITKGDGFVWIKRKHYFQPVLNPRVLARLTKGDRND